MLEDQLVDLVVYAMERSETEEKFDDGGTSQLLWQHLSSQLIFFVLFQFASFPHMVLSLHQKVSTNCPVGATSPVDWSALDWYRRCLVVSAVAEALSPDGRFVQCLYGF